MHNPKPFKSPEIPHIDRERLADAMDIHARCQSCVMDLDALNVMRDAQRAPALMGFAAVRHKLEIPHDHARELVGLGDAQAEAVLVGRGVEAFGGGFAKCSKGARPARPMLSAPVG